MATQITLTPREIALASGEDVDEIVETSVLSSEATESTPGTDAGNTTSELEPAAAETDSQGSPEVLDAAQPTDTWVNPDILDLATSYGMTEDDLATFGSEDEFRRAGMLFDRQMIGTPKPEQPVKQAEPETKEAKPESKADQKKKLDPDAYREAGYDEETVALVEALAEEQRLREEGQKVISELREWQQQFQSQVEQERIQQAAVVFHETVDGLDESLFGRAFDKDGSVRDLEQKFHDNRATLWDAMHTIEAHLTERANARGIPVSRPSHSAMMQRALMVAFPDVVIKKRTDSRVEQARQQSARRRPVGQQAAARQSHNPNSDDPKDIANDPRIVEFWNRAMEENGSR